MAYEILVADEAWLGLALLQVEHPDRESFSAKEILDRVLPSLKEIEKEHRGKKILIVCHGGVMRTIANHCLQISNSDCNIPNGGHIRLFYDGERELFTLEGA